VSTSQVARQPEEPTPLLQGQLLVLREAQQGAPVLLDVQQGPPVLLEVQQGPRPWPQEPLPGRSAL